MVVVFIVRIADFLVNMSLDGIVGIMTNAFVDFDVLCASSKLLDLQVYKMR
jgi:hypothetical protein